MTLNQADVERIATTYAMSLGVAPFVVDGSELDKTQDRPAWRVFLTFTETDDGWVGLPDGMIVDVDAVTGEASHIASL